MVGVVVAVIAIIVVAGAASVVNEWAAPRLALPASAAQPPAGPLDGDWRVSTGSVAGFRVQQTILGMTGDVVGRPDRVTGSLTIASGAVASAAFSIDLTSILVGGKRQRQCDLSLGTDSNPTATFTAAGPIALPPSFESGGVITATVTGQLAMHGTSRSVSVIVTARRDGSSVEVAGAIPVAFADWGIEGPTGYGALGSIADHAEAEFLLVLHHG